VTSGDASVEVPLRMPGHYFDPETGLHYNRFRYYSPELGRYLQVDPLLGVSETNPYAYTANPLRAVDVRGDCENDGASSSDDDKPKTTQGGDPAAGPPVAPPPDAPDGFPPRTARAVEAADAAQAAYAATVAGMTGKEGTMRNKDRPSVISVMTHDPLPDGTVPPTTVGVTSARGASNTPENNAAIVNGMQNQLGPGYHVTNEPMNTGGFHPATNPDGTPYRGNSSTCAEPRVANGANQTGSNPEGMDTRWVGRGDNPHPANEPDPALARPNQMNPCPSCEENQGAMMQHANGGG
jgi:RHS repeat-associated protein